MTEEERDILGQWLQKASNDLIAAKILIEAGPIIPPVQRVSLN